MVLVKASSCKVVAIGGRSVLPIQVERASGHVRPLEEPLGVDVIRVRPFVADMVEVDGEFRGVQRPVLPQVFPGRDDLIPDTRGVIWPRALFSSLIQGETKQPV